jgi:hypothetical protein
MEITGMVQIKKRGSGEKSPELFPARTSVTTPWYFCGEISVLVEDFLILVDRFTCHLYSDSLHESDIDL